MENCRLLKVGMGIVNSVVIDFLFDFLHAPPLQDQDLIAQGNP